jgi:hypothetical protein
MVAASLADCGNTSYQLSAFSHQQKPLTAKIAKNCCKDQKQKAHACASASEICKSQAEG